MNRSARQGCSCPCCLYCSCARLSDSHPQVGGENFTGLARSKAESTHPSAGWNNPQHSPAHATGRKEGSSAPDADPLAALQASNPPLKATFCREAAVPQRLSLPKCALSTNGSCGLPAGQLGSQHDPPRWQYSEQAKQKLPENKTQGDSRNKSTSDHAGEKPFVCIFFFYFIREENSKQQKTRGCSACCPHATSVLS